MTSDAKHQLSTTVRDLRARLHPDLHAATETAYRLSVRARDAGLAQAARVRRSRFETWMDEQVRAEAARGDCRRTPDDFRRDVEKQAAYTLLNRLVVLRLLEAADLRHPRVLIGGWESSAYKNFRELAPALVQGDESEGYAFLLQLIFEDLATDLPGIYGPAGVADLVPVPAHTLRHVVDALDDRRLESCWTDDMTLGWVYQYWNDPEREAIDDKLNAGGKVEPYEIASKTQLFTERYMVDWLLQNSLGPMWLAMCRKQRWTAEVEVDGTLQRLEERRTEWRAQRDACDVTLTDLMPLQTDAERRWAYYVPQPIPEDAVEHAPASVRELKILDPAVGSGHFLVVAFDLLLAFYREEARHRGEAGDERWSDRAIVERILEHNLHGCLLNQTRSRFLLESLNPTVNFQVGDVNRLPVRPIAESAHIYSLLDLAFSEEEATKEVSRLFSRPGPSSWRHAQDWAQTAVDRADGVPLPPYEPEFDAEPSTEHLSFALGVALGRFGAKGEGILDPAKDDLSHALPAGILFLDGTLDSKDLRDSLGHSSAEPLIAAWAEHGATISGGADLRSYLRTKCFSDVHCSMYENRPIHWPLSSEKKTFVAWVTIHRWSTDKLRVLLADHLYTPCLARLEGELADLQDARLSADKRAAGAAEKRFEKVQKWREELLRFIAAVEQCAEKGPLPTDAKCPARNADAGYVPDLDDGVMINSAALWPLLTPQWRSPKKWWKVLASAQGKKDYDWAHLAMRYWPARVDGKCRQDPSLGVAHGCFWKYHPARAWAWELRLQDEIDQDFRIEEASYRDDADDHEAHRASYLRDHASEALQAVAREAVRRRRKQKQPIKELRLLEQGLWLAIPEQCWDLELRMSEKQGEEFRLLTPEEPAARAVFEEAHPDFVLAREQLLASLTPPTDLFDQDDGEDEGEPDEDVELTEDEVPEAVNG